MKRLAGILLSLMLACSFMPSITFADTAEAGEGDTGTTCTHNWKAGTADSDYTSIDDEQHNRTYHCTLCGETKQEAESHQYSFYKYKRYDDSHHRTYYICAQCDHIKCVIDAHKFDTDTDYDYIELNSSYHMVESIKTCDDCWDDVTTNYAKKAHRMHWEGSYGYYFWMCKDCGYDSDIYAESKNKSVTVKKSGTHKVTYRCASHDKLKSASVSSGTKVVKIKSKGNTSLTYTCKKKGSATIKVKMYSGATYTFKIKVK